MGFLRRWLRGEPPDAPEGTTFDPAEAEASERERELELLRDEAERHDELIQRQLRYERFAWQPPAQGGERRADDEDRTSAD